MADEIQFDDFGDDPLLDADLSDMSFGEEEIQDDRNPITKASASVLDGFQSKVENKGFIGKVVKDSLPKGYGDFLDRGDALASDVRTVYNESAAELRPAIRDLKKAARLHLSKVEGILPKTATEKLDKFLETQESTSKQGPSREEIVESKISSELAAIFQTQAVAQEERNARDTMTNLINEDKENTRHETSLQSSELSRDAINRLVAYQDNVTSAYQRKSLDLQFRQFYATRDLLDLTRLGFGDFKNHLGIIAKNTGLPEAVKEQLNETQQQMLRERISGAISDSIQERVGGALGRVRDRVVGNIREAVGRARDGLNTGADTLTMFAEMQEMQADMGMPQQSTADQATGFVGGLIGDSIAERAAQSVRERLTKYFEENERVAEGGNLLGTWMSTLGQQINEFASGEDRMGPLGFLQEFVRDSVGNMGESASVLSNLLTDAGESVPFDLITRRSIIEIIPGYLSRILQQAEIANSENGEADRLVFDAQSEDFMRLRDAAISASQLVASRDNMDSIGQQLRMAVEAIDGQEILSNEARMALGRQLLDDARNGLTVNRERYTDEDRAFRDANFRVRQELIEFFEERYNTTEQGAFKGAQASKNFSNDVKIQTSIQRSLPEVQNSVNQLVTTGDKELLREAGIITNDGSSDRFDFDSIYERTLNTFDDALSGIEPRAEDDTETQRVAQVAQAIVDAPEQGKVDLSVIESHLKALVDKPDPRLDLGSTNSLLEQISLQLRNSNAANVREREITNAVMGSVSGELMKFNARPDSTIDVVGSVRTIVQDSTAEVKSQLTQDINPLKDMVHGLNHAIMGKVDSPTIKEVLDNIDDNVTLIGEALIEGLDTEPKSNEVVFPSSHDEKMDSIISLLGEINTSSANNLAGMSALMEKFSNAIPTYNIDADQLKEMLNQNKGGKSFLDRAKETAGKGFSIGKDFITGYYRTLGNIATSAFDQGKALIGRLTSKTKDKDGEDIYVGADTTPSLKWKDVKAGMYIDKLTGKVIQKMEDITGEVIDRDGNVVISAADFTEKGVFGREGKSIVNKAAEWATTKPIEFLKDYYGWWGDRGSDAIELGKRTIRALTNTLVEPKDIYVGDEEEPRILKHLLVKGYYYSAKTGKPIYTLSDIDGDILDEDKNIVLSAEDMKQGLYDADGKEIKLDGLLMGLRNFADGKISAGLDLGRKAVKKVGDFYRGVFDRAGDLFNKGMDKLGFGGNDGETTIEGIGEMSVRAKIVHLYADHVDFRAKPDDPDNGPMGGGDDSPDGSGGSPLKPKTPFGPDLSADLLQRFTDAKDTIGDRLSEAQENLMEEVENSELMDRVVETQDKIRASIEESNVMDRLTETQKDVKDSIVNAVKDLGTRLGGPKTSATDKDGDGIRDGSWRDQRKKRREQKAREAAEKEAAGEGNNKGKIRKGNLMELLGSAGSVIGGIGSGALSLLGGAAGGGLLAKLNPFARGGAQAAGQAATQAAGQTAAQGAARAGAQTASKGIVGRTATMLGRGAMAGLKAGGSLLKLLPQVGRVALGPIGWALTAAYYAYKGGRALADRMSAEPLEALRYSHYGIDPSEDSLASIRQLERMYEDHLTYDDNGQASFTDIDYKELFEDSDGLFGFNSGSAESAKQFSKWLKDTFEPVFLSHATAAHATDSDIDLLDVDDEMDDDAKPKFANVVQENIMTSDNIFRNQPFQDKKKITVDPIEYYNKIEGVKELDLSEPEKPKPMKKFSSMVDKDDEGNIKLSSDSLATVGQNNSLPDVSKLLTKNEVPTDTVMDSPMESNSGERAVNAVERSKQRAAHRDKVAASQEAAIVKQDREQSKRVENILNKSLTVQQNMHKVLVSIDKGIKELSKGKVEGSTEKLASTQSSQNTETIDFNKLQELASTPDKLPSAPINMSRAYKLDS